MRYRLVLCMMFIFMIVPTVRAQEHTSPCEEALSLAELSFADNDLEKANSLAENALNICANDVLLLRDVVNLQTRIDAAETQAELDEALATASPGLVNIGDVNIFMTCVGEGSPTVIFENGLGMTVDIWNDVYATIAEHIQVCRYERLGVGLSDAVPDQIPRTSLEQSAELKAVLETAEIEPPYILVGHSIAGYMLVSFTHLYPDDVAGVVFVDASIPENAQGVLSDGSARGAERLDVLESYRLLQAEDASDMGNRPVVVLVAMHRFEGAQAQSWIAESELWHASRSTNTRFSLAEVSGHFIQNDEPELVIESIEWVLSQIKTIP